MTQFGEAVARVQERIDSAPVADYLKAEAREDLKRLMVAHQLDLTDMKWTESPVQESPVQAYVPSDYDMRQMAMHASNGNAATARDLYKFLKGE